MGARAVRSVRFKYAASEELASLFEEFRLMCNDAVRIALAYENENGKKVRSRFQLIELAYHRLKEYGCHTHYILSACEVAFASYRKNRGRVPYVKNPFLKLYNQSYLLNHLILRIPSKPRRFIHLTLQGSDYHLSYIDDPNLKRGSITITPDSLSIAISKEAGAIEPLGHLGIDVNESNVTWSDSSGETKKEEITEVAEIKDRYRAIRARIGERTRQDKRVGTKLYAKYGRRERNRALQRLHVVSRRIVRHAKEKRLGIVMEKLKGIRRLYRRGNGQGASFRGRMNSWTFREIQRQIEYKARWEGVSVTYVNPRGTSRNCPECGSRVSPLADRKLYCPGCDTTWDRDVLASKNVMAAPVRAARPPRGSCEGEPRRQEKAGNPPSGWVEAGLSR